MEATVMLIYQWAKRHSIPLAALADLLHLMGLAAADTQPAAGPALSSEAGVQQQVRLAAARTGQTLLWRNNVGACEDKDGRVIRYGLCNESTAMNQTIKSSDLIGITTVTDPVSGWKYGLFTALECKKPGWHITPGDKRAQAQLRFIQLVVSRGGVAQFVTDPSQIGAPL